MSLTKSPRGNAGVLLLLLLLLAVLVACGKTVPAPQLPSPPTPQPTAVLPSPSPPSISQALSPSEARRRINEAYGRAVRLTRIGETASAERALGLVRQIYVAAFQEVAIRIDGETYLFMARAMVEAQNAVPAKNAEVVSLSQQWTDMGLYK
ncbi:MAG: hypothetical protein HYY31_02100, partial [Chloroflexi bacterium]|nr:hypothetical protein [Chloroflexota bacterium]